MASTKRQTLGDFGENAVARQIRCPKCKRPERTLRMLPPSFKCADIICDFCGYLAQVKSVTCKETLDIPARLLGAAWKPQAERMSAGIYTPIFIVCFFSEKKYSIYYLPVDFQNAEMFVPREPLSSRAKRPGWQGFLIELERAQSRAVLVFESNT